MKNLKSSLNQSGQALLISVFLLALVGLTIPVLVYVESHAAKASVSNRKFTKYSTSVQEVFNKAVQALSASQTTWSNAMAGTYPAICTAPIASLPDGMYYQVQCTRPPENPMINGNPTEFEQTPYQIKVVATLYKETDGDYKPVYAASGYVSALTIGVALPGGTNVSGALDLKMPLVNPTNFVVHWGPIISYADNFWDENFGTMDTYRFPRKFGLRGISGSVYPRSSANVPPTTDQREYWAYAQMGSRPEIDFAYYKAKAKATTDFHPAITVASGNMANVVNNPAGSAFYQVLNNDVLIIDKPGALPFDYISSTGVIYIEGNATFMDIGINVKDEGAVIVMGNMRRNVTVGRLVGNPVWIPQTAKQEYPYSTPCAGVPTSENDCYGVGTVIPGLSFRGFLYVQGNLNVPVENHFGGVIRCDGWVEANKTKLMYDDFVNHNIKMAALKVKVDSIINIPTSTGNVGGGGVGGGGVGGGGIGGGGVGGGGVGGGGIGGGGVGGGGLGGGGLGGGFGGG